MSLQHHQHQVLTWDSSVRNQCGAKTLSICVSLNEYLATYWITFPSLHGNAGFLSVWVQCSSLLMAWLTAHILHWIASVTARLPNYSCPRDSLWWIRSVFLCLLKGLSIFSCSSASHLFFFFPLLWRLCSFLLAHFSTGHLLIYKKAFKYLENSVVATGMEKVSFHFNPK